jgi:ABC-type nitrate/sulfonate/bicarbonate transport system permease component
MSQAHLLPGPWGVLGGIADLIQQGLLLKYTVASLFRVTLGFSAGGGHGHSSRACYWLVSPCRNGGESGR